MPGMNAVGIKNSRQDERDRDHQTRNEILAILHSPASDRNKQHILFITK